MTFNEDINFYKEILDNLSYEVFVTDKEGIILYCNEAFSRNYCYNLKDILGTHVSSISTLIKKGTPIIPMVIKNHREISLFQETIHGKKLFLNAKPIFNTDGTIKMIVENAREVLNLPSGSDHSPHQQNINKTRLKSIVDTYGIQFAGFSNMKNLNILTKIANFDVTVLLLGESGTGKSTCAKFIHSCSSRKSASFITVNCTTIPDSLVESELFGYVKGAFTGASKDGKKGLVELANNGTLFLDEIGDLPLGSQSKLLELIQENTYTPVGGTSKKNVNIRIIAATNKNLREMISNGSFREDLYYRINVVEHTIPALRERRSEITLIASLLLQQLNTKYNTNKSFSNDLLTEFISYNWPGNIRQLEHVIEKLIITSDDDLLNMKQVYKYLDYTKVQDSPSEDSIKLPTLKSQLESAERALIIVAYNQLKTSYKVAEALGISQSQASRKIRKYIFK